MDADCTRSGMGEYIRLGRMSAFTSVIFMSVVRLLNLVDIDRVSVLYLNDAFVYVSDEPSC